MFSTDKKSRIIHASNLLDDKEAEEFLERLKDSLQDGINDIILNCSQLNFATSKQIGTLLAAFEYCAQKGIRCRISSPKADLCRMIKMLDLEVVLLPSGADDETTILFNTSRLPVSRQVSYRNKFIAGIGEIREASGELNRVLRKENWPGSIISDICTIFYEISTNVRLYGGGNAANNIEFSIDSNESGITMSFLDDGLPFDPTRYKSYDDVIHAAKSGKTRGFGIILVRKLSDRMKYRRENGTTNILRIEKRWDSGRE